MSLDNILDQTLDDLADMPAIQLWPNGAHKADISFKVDKEKQSVQLTMVYVECLELADPAQTPPAPGDKNTVFFNLKKKDGTRNEYAEGALKNALLGIKAVGGSTSYEIMENASGCEVAVVTKIRKGKGEYEGRDTLDIVRMELI